VNAKQASPSLSKWTLVALLAGAIFLGDLVTKYLAVERLTFAFTAVNAQTFGAKVSAYFSQQHLWERGLSARPFIVIESFLQFAYAENPGAAFSFLAGAGAAVRVPFFHAITLFAVVFISFYLRRLSREQRLLQVALALLLGGALGNGLDRLVRGYVIDFIAVHWFDPHWTQPARHFPTFNIADCGVTIGIALLLLESFLPRKETAAPKVQG
jgi:signal peptidase II